MTRIDHAYAHWVGRIVGIKIDGVGIVAGTVMTPDVGQDHNYLNIMTGDSVWHSVRWNETYRADFVNASLNAPVRCAVCKSPSHETTVWYCMG